MLYEHADCAVFIDPLEIADDPAFWSWADDRCRDNEVVVLETIHARGRGSGVELESQRSATIWTLRDGRVTRVQVGLDPREALKAVGLEG